MYSQKWTAALNALNEAIKQLNNIADDLDEQEGIASTVGMSDLLVGYYELKEAYKQLDAARKRVYSTEDMFNKAIIPARFDDEGMDKIQVPTIGRSFYPLQKFSASMVDKEKGYEWLRSVGGEGIITETVNAGTLASFCKDLVKDQGIDPPEDIINFRSYHITGISKYTPKK